MYVYEIPAHWTRVIDVILDEAKGQRYVKYKINITQGEVEFYIVDYEGKNRYSAGEEFLWYNPGEVKGNVFEDTIRLPHSGTWHFLLVNNSNHNAMYNSEIFVR